MTEIILATKPGHYRACYGLMKRMDSPWANDKLGFPTVIALKKTVDLPINALNIHF